MKPRQNKGFTLIELMISMAILAFGIMGFTFLNSRALQNRTFSRDLNRAAVVAESFAENLVSLEYDDDLLDDDNSDSNATEYPGSDLSDEDTGTIFDLNYTVKAMTYENPITNTVEVKKWFRIIQEKQRYYVRWDTVDGNDGVTGTPQDDVKLLRIFTAFEKKDPKDNAIMIGGYNPVTLGPNVITFKMDR